MKKIILTVAAVFAMTLANAQDLKSKKGENFLPEAGDWAIGFNADGLFNYVGNAFNGSNVAPTVGFQNAGTFVGKKFITDKTAYRVIANLAAGANTSTSNGFVNNAEIKTSGFDLAAGLGKEWRRGTTRLQGFYGADALITIESNSTETTNTNATTGAFVSSSEFKSGLALGLGAQGFIGAEYFLFPKIAIGAQYTYRVGFDIQGKSETTTQVGSAAATTVDGGKSANFGIGGVGVSSINLTLHF